MYGVAPNTNSKDLSMTDRLPLMEGARFLGVHPTVLGTAARRGWIPSEWGTNINNRPSRMFLVADLVAYKCRQRERLLSRLAKMEDA